MSHRYAAIFNYRVSISASFDTLEEAREAVSTNPLGTSICSACKDKVAFDEVDFVHIVDNENDRVVFSNEPGNEFSRLR